jgi:hypothetical protein
MSKFVTKDSGERQTFETGMMRDSGQKDLRPDLLPGPMLVRWAELMGRGAAKYKARNWEKACTEEELERFREGAFRHFVQWFYGLNTEEDHAAAVFFNISGAEHVKARLQVAPKPSATGRVRVINKAHSFYDCFGEVVGVGKKSGRFKVRMDNPASCFGDEAPVIWVDPSSVVFESP